MDDTQSKDKNQNQLGGLGDIPVALEAEEVSPEIENPDEIKLNAPQMPSEIPVYEENKSKYMFIGGIVIFFLIVFGVVIWLLLRGKSTNPLPTVPQIVKKTPVTLTYWGLWDEKEVYAPVFEAYHKANPHVTIVYEKIAAREQYRQRLIARSKTGNGPDIFRFHNTWVPELSEILSDVPEQLFPAKQYESTYYPVILKDMKVGSKYYGIPLMIDGMMLYYNDAMLRQAGILGPPGVWIGDQNDMSTVAHALTVKNDQGEVITSGLAMGTTSNISHFSSLYGLLLLVNGGDLRKLDQPEAAEALQFYRKNAEDGLWTDALPNSVSAFIQGKVAMMIGPSWEILEIKAKNPTLSFKTASMPKGLNNKSVSVATYWAEGVSRYSKNQTEAWKLLIYLSQKNQLERIYQEQTKTRPIGWIYPRRDMTALAKSIELIVPIVKHADANELVSLPIDDSNYDEGLNDELVQYIRNSINESAKGVDYAAALRSAHAGITQVYARYKIE